MRVLSLCGGGTSGYMTACFLSLIERETGKKIKDCFDFFTGTSTGSLVSSSLVTDKSPEEIKQLFKDFYDDIFGKRRNFIMNLFKPKYDTDNFNKICEKQFGNLMIGDLDKNFMTLALELNYPELKPKFWKSWDIEDKDKKLSDCVIASSSFPSGFYPHVIGSKFYYDGGLAANDPSLCALADCVNHFGADPRDIRILTIQTDFNSGYFNPENFGGLISIIKEVPTFFIDGGEKMVEYIINRIYGKKIATYITPKVYFPVDSNEWDKMENIVNITWNNQKEEILKFFK